MFLLLSQSPRIAFPSSCCVFAFHDNIQNSFCSHIRRVTSFLIVFSESVLHVVANILFWVRRLGFQPRMYCFQYSSNPFIVRFLPLTNLLETSLSPHICTAVPSLPTGVVSPVGPTFPGSSSFSALRCSPIFGLCTTECVTFIRVEVKKLLMSIMLAHLFLFSIQSSSQAHADADLSHTHIRDYATPTCDSMLCANDGVRHNVDGSRVFHHQVLLHAKTCRKVSKTAFRTPVAHPRFLAMTSHRKSNLCFLYDPRQSCHRPPAVPNPRLVFFPIWKENNLLNTCVSHPLILFKACWLHDQLLLGGIRCGSTVEV